MTISEWKGQLLAFYPTRTARADALAICAGRQGRLISTPEWNQIMGDINNGILIDLFVNLAISLYDFGDNGNRPWNAWADGGLPGNCAAVQLDSTAVAVASSSDRTTCSQQLYLACLGPKGVAGPPPPSPRPRPPPPSPPPPSSVSKSPPPVATSPRPYRPPIHAGGQCISRKPLFTLCPWGTSVRAS